TSTTTCSTGTTASSTAASTSRPWWRRSTPRACARSRSSRRSRSRPATTSTSSTTSGSRPAATSARARGRTSPPASPRSSEREGESAASATFGRLPQHGETLPVGRAHGDEIVVREVKLPTDPADLVLIDRGNPIVRRNGEQAIDERELLLPGRDPIELPSDQEVLGSTK